MRIVGARPIERETVEEPPIVDARDSDRADRKRRRRARDDDVDARRGGERAPRATERGGAGVRKTSPRSRRRARRAKTARPPRARSLPASRGSGSSTHPAAASTDAPHVVGLARLASRTSGLLRTARAAASRCSPRSRAAGAGLSPHVVPSQHVVRARSSGHRSDARSPAVGAEARIVHSRTRTAAARSASQPRRR